MKKLLSIAVLMALVGCGAVPRTPVEDQKAALDSKQLCCVDLKAVNYEPLVVNSPKKAILDEAAPVKQFSQGRSYFKAFSIPAGEKQGIWIKSYFNGMYIKQFLRPLVLFLREDHSLIGTAIPRMQFREGNLFGDSSARMEGGVIVPPNARYLLVYTAAFDSGPGAINTAPSTGVLMLGNTPVVTSDAGKSIDLEASTTGKLALELKQFLN